MANARRPTPKDRINRFRIGVVQIILYGSKKLLVTSASLLVTSALLVVTRTLLGTRSYLFFLLLMFVRPPVSRVETHRGVNLESLLPSVAGPNRTVAVSTVFRWRRMDKELKKLLDLDPKCRNSFGMPVAQKGSTALENRHPERTQI